MVADSPEKMNAARQPNAGIEGAAGPAGARTRDSKVGSQSGERGLDASIGPTAASPLPKRRFPQSVRESNARQQQSSTSGGGQRAGLDEAIRRSPVGKRLLNESAADAALFARAEERILGAVGEVKATAGAAGGVRQDSGLPGHGGRGYRSVRSGNSVAAGSRDRGRFAPFS